MTLRSRLTRLEASQGRPAGPTGDAPPKLGKRAAEMLATCYGRLHALFHPARSHPQSWPALRALRQAYVAGQSGIAARASGATDWKRSQEARRELSAAGLADIVATDAEVTGLKLTRPGRGLAAAWVEDIVPTINYSDILFQVLLELPVDRVRGQERWISEASIGKLFEIDCVGDCTAWQGLTDATIEPAIDGCIESLCDIRGRCFYRVSSDSWEPLPIADVEPSEHLAGLYVQAFIAEMSRLRSLEGAEGAISIPLSVSN